MAFFLVFGSLDVILLVENVLSYMLHEVTKKTNYYSNQSPENVTTMLLLRSFEKNGPLPLLESWS